MNAVTAIADRNTTTASFALVPASMSEAIQLAQLMASQKLVPQHLQGSPGDCLMIVEQAMRWRMSPFAVAQCTSSIKGKLCYEGKIVAAAVETSGAIIGLMDYEFSGEGPSRKITVTATRRGEKQPRSVEVAWKDAKTDNQWWTKTPDQMLVYHGSRVWGRRWTPAVILGVYSPEEIEQPHREPPHNGPTVEHEQRPRLAKPAPQAAPAEPERDEPAADPEPEPAPRSNPRSRLVARLAACTSAADVRAIRDEPFKEWCKRQPEAVQSDIAALIAARMQALGVVDGPAPEPEPVRDEIDISEIPY